MIIEIIAVLLLILAFPIGYYIAYLCSDEILQIRKWIYALIIVCGIALISSFFLSEIDISVSATLLFIILVSLVSIWKSYNKKFIVHPI